jgi:hypothetical protein
MSTQHTPLHIGKPTVDLPGFICIRTAAETGEWSIAWTADVGTAERIVRECNAHREMLAALREVSVMLLASHPDGGICESSRKIARDIVRAAIEKAQAAREWWVNGDALPPYYELVAFPTEADALKAAGGRWTPIRLREVLEDK